MATLAVAASIGSDARTDENYDVREGGVPTNTDGDCEDLSCRDVQAMLLPEDKEPPRQPKSKKQQQKREFRERAAEMRVGITLTFQEIKDDVRARACRHAPLVLPAQSLSRLGSSFFSCDVCVSL